MKHFTRAAAAACLAVSALASQAAPITLTYNAKFVDMMGDVFDQPLPYAFSTTFTIESTASPVDVVLKGVGNASDFYGYGLDAISGFSAVFGSHTFTNLVAMGQEGLGGGYIYFDAPLSSGLATNFFVRAEDSAGTLTLGSRDCSSGECAFATFALVSEMNGNLAIAPGSAGTIAVSAPVPEPATWALMLAGLGAVGAVARRRRAGR